MNDGVKVNLAELREPEEDVTMHKMTKYRKDLAQENEKMDDHEECDMVKTTKNESGFHEDEMRTNARKLQCPQKIPGMLEYEKSAGGTTMKTKRNSCCVGE